MFQRTRGRGKVEGDKQDLREKATGRRGDSNLDGWSKAWKKW